MNASQNYLLLKLQDEGHVEIAEAFKAGKIDNLNAREKMILTEFSISVKAAQSVLNVNRVRSALVEVTTSGWGKESESTEPGFIQPLMNL